MREEPLESFWDFLSDDDDATELCWLIIPPPEVKEAAREVQESFRHLDWVAPVPEHFLHVSAPSSAAGWEGVEPFSVSFGRVNCFHDAAVAEVHAGAGSPFPPAPFLPHLSIGYFRRAERKDDLRDAIAQHRDVELGSVLVDEVLACDVAVGKSRFFQPWQVVERIRLRG